MKNIKFGLIILLIIGLSMVSACSKSVEPKPLPDNLTEETLDQKFAQVLESVDRRDWNTIKSFSTEEFAQAFDEKAQGQVEDILKDVGKVTGHEKISTMGVEEDGVLYGLAVGKVHFEQKDLDLQLTFDTEGKLAGMYFK